MVSCLEANTHGSILTGAAVGVDPPRIYKIVKGERGISGDTALRLARYFSNTPEFWINLQSRYELEMARYEAEERIEQEVKPRVYA
jgi:addiction module HigA family antidote